MSGTIIDSNVIIDIADPKSTWKSWAKRWMADARLRGALVFNIVIAAEVAHEFLSEDRFERVFDPQLWKLEEIPLVAARVAGMAHRDYRLRGGKRERTLPDFLIGAHASVAGHRLLTRDPAGYRSYFPDIEIVAPDTHP
jgi:predicted nucleic acid-binding protein